jgi:aryl-alcohol dehydrogenase-like predicted oxidoreductase
MACLGARYRRPLDVPLLVRLDDAGEAFHIETGMPLFPYSSQANGYYRKAACWGVDSEKLQGHPFNTPRNNALAARLSALSVSSGYSITALTLAWWRTKPYSVYPVIGCRTPDQLADSLTSLRVDEPVLEKLALIEENVHPEAG